MTEDLWQAWANAGLNLAAIWIIIRMTIATVRWIRDGFAAGKTRESEMRLLSMWREARGRGLRAEFENAVSLMGNATPEARRAFQNNLHQCYESLRTAYDAAPASERKRMQKIAKASAITMWQRGDWPSALGLGVAMIHLESQHVPGADAAQIRAASTSLIAEAAEAARRV